MFKCVWMITVDHCLLLGKLREPEIIGLLFFMLN